VPDHATGEDSAGKVRRAIVARGFPYFVVYVDLVRHPKVNELGRIVGSVPAARGYLVALWSFTAEYFGDGRIPNRPGVIEDLERLASWVGDPGTLVSALVTCRFLKRGRHALEVHGWHEYQAPHVAKRERDRARKRRKRAEGQPHVSADSPRSVRGTRHAEPDREPDKERELEPASHSDRRSHCAGTPAAGWQEGSNQGEDPVLAKFRADLAPKVGVVSIGVGKDSEAVLSAFHRQIKARGRAEVLDLCVEAAGLIEANGHGRPANLAAFVGWLNTVPLPVQLSP
jgi:hypothetical protein